MTTPLPYSLPMTQDERIHDDVCRQITWQTDIQSGDIQVEVRGGKVFLSGRVETCLERSEAEKAAKAPYGVTGVVNSIIIEPKQRRTDAEIAADIIASLRSCTSILEELPEVTVRDGVAILKGRSRWMFQRCGAEHAALAIVGVKRVINMIEIDQASVRERPISTQAERRQTAHHFELQPLLSLKAS